MSVPFVPAEFTPPFLPGMYGPAPGPAASPFPMVGWQQEVHPPVAMLCDLTGRPIIELPLVEANASDSLSKPNEATLSVSLAMRPELDALLQPWTSSIVLLVENEPVFGGTIVKRRITLGATVLELTVREWSAWLDRVWTTATTEYIAPTTLQDAGLVLKQRIDQAAELLSGYDLVPPIGGLDWSAAVGIECEIDFEDQSEEPSPQTFLAQLGVLAGLGFDWRMPWVLDGVNYVMTVETRRFDPEAVVRAISIGGDSATATLEVDSDAQATLVKVIGADIDGTKDTTPHHYPPLWRVFSYDKVGSTAVSEPVAQAQVDALAEALRRQLAQPVVSASNVVLPGLRNEYLPGALVALVVPSDFDVRFPDGMTMMLRVAETQWTWKARESSTSLTLTALWESIPNAEPAPGRNNFLDTLRNMQARIQAVETRRVR